jgi:serine/threonine protein kinase
MSETLEAIQESVLDALHRGEPVDRSALLAAHSEHAAALQGFFRVLEAIEAPVADAPTAPPARLGEFEIVRELGRGGMGIVYEAVQLSLKRRVALKILPPALGGSSALASRFRREAEAAARLRHPGIVPVYAYGEVSGTPFFALELVEGRSLAAVIADLRADVVGALPSDPSARRRWSVELAAKVAEALAYAHGQGIVHRDVKPANILLEQDGTPRLTDFGLASEEGRDTLSLSGEVFGSPRYMSPEQAFRRVQPIDGRSDVYSLGVTLYELVTLHFPYRGETSSEYLSEVSEGRLVPPRSFEAAITPALEQVLLRALAHQPEQRYPSAAAFASDLRDLAGRWDALERAAAPAKPEPAAASTRVAPPPLRTAATVANASGEVENTRSTGRWKLPVLLAAASLLIGFAFLFLLWRSAAARQLEAAVAHEQLAQAHAARSLAAEELARRIGPLRATELAELADEEHPNGVRRLREATRVDLDLRSVLARDVPLVYGVQVRVQVADNVPPDVEISASLVIARDGRTPHYSTGEQVFPNIAVRTCELRFALDATQVLGLSASELASTAPLSTTLRHEVMVRVCRPGRTTGTLYRVPSQDVSLTVHPRYPTDYPKAVVGIDELMQRALTPLGGRIELVQDPAGEKLALCTLDMPSILRPAPVAGRAMLFLEGAPAPLASGSFQLDEAPLSAVHAGERLALTLSLRMSSIPQEDRDEVKRALETKGLRMRVHLESDRELALRTTRFEELWYGKVDATVPFEYVR